MTTLSNYFGMLAETAAITFVLLGLGVAIVTLLAQPIERVRAIQGTIFALVAALAIRQAGILPTLPIARAPHLVADNAEHSPILAAPRPVAPSIPATTLHSNQVAVATPVASTQQADTRSIAQLKAETSNWPRILPRVQSTVVAVVLLGAAWRIVLWAIGRIRLERLIRQASPVESENLIGWQHQSDADQRGVRILASETVDVPLTCGVWRQVIIVPTTFLEPGNHGELTACLDHEWSHVAHRDALIWFFVRLIEPAVWFQPFFWRLKRELRVCQDQLADESAVQSSGDRITYAELLAGLGRRRATWDTVPVLSMTDRPSNLRRRIESLLSDSSATRLSARRGVTTALLIVLTTAGLVLAAAGAANDAKNETPPSKPAATEQALSYTGEIIDAKTKKPLVGAGVRVRLSNHTGPDKKVLSETNYKTDANGKYTFVITPDQVAEPRLYVELQLKHPGYITKRSIGYSLAMILRNDKLGQPPFFKQLSMRRSDPVTGRILDPQGRPLAGVPIRAYTSTSRNNLNGGNWPTTKSDADGRFSIEAVEGGVAVIGIVPEEYAPVQLILDGKFGDQGDIRVEDGIRLRGLLLDAESKPVPGVWVNVYDETEGGEIKMSVMTPVSRSCLTDAEGHFDLRPLKSHSCELRVQESPSEPLYERDRNKQVPLNDVFLVKKFDLGKIDTNLPMTINALPCVDARGRFVDSQGKPTTGWQIRIAGQIGEEWFFGSWDPDSQGSFAGKIPIGLKRAQLDAISNEHHALRVHLHKNAPLKSARDFNLGPIDSDLLNMEIVKFVAPIVQIAVEDESGRPIKDAKLSGVYDNDDKTFTPTATNIPTNVWFEKQSNGIQRTEQMMPDVKTTFTAHAEGYEDASETLALSEKAERKITLKLKKKSG